MKRFWLLFFLTTLLILLSTSCRDHQPPKVAIKNSSIFKEAEVRQVLVKGEGVKVYAGGGFDFPIVTTVNSGDLLNVIGLRDHWYVVILENKEIGCIEKDKVVPYVESVDVDENILLDDHLFPEEKEMVDLVNLEREKMGLKPLKIDLNLTKIARLKSKDLIENEYFNHYSPTYGSPFDMIEKYKISYIFAGENLAGNESVKGAHNSLMESTTHRQNILNPTFTHIGVGMEKGGPYKRIFTQMFIGR